MGVAGRGEDKLADGYTVGPDGALVPPPEGFERRTRSWRPGGEHRDPREKYQLAKKAKWQKFKKMVRSRPGHVPKPGDDGAPTSDVDDITPFETPPSDQVELDAEAAVERASQGGSPDEAVPVADWRGRPRPEARLLQKRRGGIARSPRSAVMSPVDRSRHGATGHRASGGASLPAVSAGHGSRVPGRGGQARMARPTSGWGTRQATGRVAWQARGRCPRPLETRPPAAHPDPRGATARRRSIVARTGRVVPNPRGMSVPRRSTGTIGPRPQARVAGQAARRRAATAGRMARKARRRRPRPVEARPPGGVPRPDWRDRPQTFDRGEDRPRGPKPEWRERPKTIDRDDRPAAPSPSGATSRKASGATNRRARGR